MPTMPISCGNCGQGVAAEIVHADSESKWLQCPMCRLGSVWVKWAVYSVAPAGGTVVGTPDDVAQAWREARTAHAVAAYTASEMMCRKILMHVAVDVAQSPPGKSFVQYIDDLVAGGYVTAGLKPVVDKVRQRGNGAVHELPASTEADSLTTLKITEYLLRGVYELPGL